MPCRAMLGQQMFNQVMQKQNSLHWRGRELRPRSPWHLMAQAFFCCFGERDSVPSSAWGGLRLSPASSTTALMISLEQATRSKGFPNSSLVLAPFASSDEPSWHQLARTNLLPCTSNFFTEKLSHLLFSVHSEFQVLVLKDVSLSICTWKSWP